MGKKNARVPCSPFIWQDSDFTVQVLFSLDSDFTWIRASVLANILCSSFQYINSYILSFILDCQQVSMEATILQFLSSLLQPVLIPLTADFPWQNLLCISILSWYVVIFQGDSNFRRVDSLMISLINPMFFPPKSLRTPRKKKKKTWAPIFWCKLIWAHSEVKCSSNGRHEKREGLVTACLEI